MKTAEEILEHIHDLKSDLMLANRKLNGNGATIGKYMYDNYMATISLLDSIEDFINE